jgi:hypothetical protein
MRERVEAAARAAGDARVTSERVAETLLSMRQPGAARVAATQSGAP